MQALKNAQRTKLKSRACKKDDSGKSKLLSLESSADAKICKSKSSQNVVKYFECCYIDNAAVLQTLPLIYSCHLGSVLSFSIHTTVILLTFGNWSSVSLNPCKLWVM